MSSPVLNIVYLHRSLLALALGIVYNFEINYTLSPPQKTPMRDGTVPFCD